MRIVANIIFSGALLLPGCDTSVQAADGGANAADASAVCAEARDHSDLAWLQANVFTRSCAGFSSCHKGGAGDAAGLNLEDGMTEANVVGVLATSQPAADDGWLLVAPGDPSASYLMVIMDHTDKGGRFSGPLPAAGTMPFNNSLLCVEKLEAVHKWISSLPTGNQ